MGPLGGLQHSARPVLFKGPRPTSKGREGKRRGTMEKGDEGKKERKERKRTEEKVGKGS